MGFFADYFILTFVLLQRHYFSSLINVAIETKSRCYIIDYYFFTRPDVYVI